MITEKNMRNGTITMLISFMIFFVGFVGPDLLVDYINQERDDIQFMNDHIAKFSDSNLLGVCGILKELDCDKGVINKIGGIYFTCNSKTAPYLGINNYFTDITVEYYKDATGDKLIDTSNFRFKNKINDQGKYVPYTH